MSGERYVLLGLAGARAEWFRTLGHWSASAMLPVEFVRCVSAAELRIRLSSGRAFSAALLDGALPEVDRDLIAETATAGVAALVVDDSRRRDWQALGATAVLAPRHSRDELLELLAATATMVGAATLPDPAAPRPTSHSQGELVAVLGPGGTGASTVAIALAQGLATGADRRGRAGSGTAAGGGERSGRKVLLADLCRVADQAMLHDSRVVVPSIQELVEAHRASTPSRAALLEETFEVPARGYRLVLGLRRARHWVALRPRAVEATLDSLHAAVDVMVADVEPDVEGEAESGSVDVEERNLLARASVARASVTLVVGEPSLKGLHALVRVIGDLVEFGVATDRVLPVLNRAPLRPRQRAELTAALAELVAAGTPDDSAVLPPVFLPRRPTDEALRDGMPIPAPLPGLLARAVVAALGRAQDPGTDRSLVRRIIPGSLTGLVEQEPPT